MSPSLRSLLLLACTLCTLCTLQAASAAPLCESWQSGYSGKDANGAHVLGYWRFDDETATADTSSKGTALKLSGAQRAAAGIRGGALEAFPGMKERHAALCSPSAALSPKGPFSIELWVNPKPDMPADGAVLLDKKYVAHTDYQLRLTPADKAGSRRLEVNLGFGDDSETFHSEPFKLEPGAWQHLAFTYDAAGEVRFFRNGAPLGTVRKSGRGPIARGKHGLSIGDRVGSNYAGFAGLIDEVRICDGVLEFRPIAVSFEADRWTWLRMEKAKPIGIVVHNLSRGPIEGAEVTLSAEGSGEKHTTLRKLGPGESFTLQQPVDTQLRPGTYRVAAKVQATIGLPYSSEEHAEFIIAPRPLPYRMPVVMWGIGGPANVRREMPRLKDLGFTHCLGGGADYGAIWDAKAPVPPAKPETIAETKRMLDFALAENFGIAFSLSPGGWLKQRPELQRVDRTGKPYARPDVDASLPGLAQFAQNVGASIAQTYRDFPAWQAALINTEARDDSQVSFAEFDREACKKATGADIPPEVTTKSGVDWTKLKDFPSDRIIPDDHPLLRFYRWFWMQGDGWNSLHSAVHRGVKSSGRDDVWTWFDPAIRAPSVPGSGGDVDVLSQWTYTYPDPLRIGFYADELFAMASSTSPGHRVMKMTQLIWYRSRTAPKKAGAKHIASPFDDHDPDAAYITIAPMHLREAFWTKIARPVSGIMYHGWESLVPTESTGAYRYTNPDTQNELRRLLRGVIEPLGPTLLQVPDRPTDVAYLDSFTSQMFARRGSYGYGSDEAYLTLLYAQLQPAVIFEDTIAKRGLDGYKVLVLADCDVLPAGIAQKIRDFQKRGGLVIGDENLAPGIKADISIPKVKRTDRGDADKATLLANASKLRAALEGKYSRHAESSNPEVVVRSRAAGSSDYVFAVNDRREYGDYVGQHGLVMENGLPAEAEVSLRRDGTVYDLLAHHAVKTTREGERLRWPASLGPAEGRIYLVTPEPIDAVRLDLPDSTNPGKALKAEVSIVDRKQQPIPAVIPVQVEITDPAGRAAEFSGYYGAKDGRLSLSLDVASNDSAGTWQIRVRELASGLEETRWFRVAR